MLERSYFVEFLQPFIQALQHVPFPYEFGLSVLFPALNFDVLCILLELQ